MADELKSAKQTLQHAIEHCLTFFEREKAWLSQNPFTLSDCVDPMTGETVVRLVRTIPLPERIENVAADAIRNFRAALDQTAYALSEPSKRSSNNTHFPFGDKLHEVNNRRAHGSSAIVQELLDVMVNDCKPYRDGNTPLWAINKLRNPNDHRITCAVNVKPGSVVTGAQVGPMFVGVGLGGLSSRWQPDQTELEIMRLPVGEIGPTILVKDIALTFGEVVGDRSIHTIFTAMAKTVHATIRKLEEKAIDIGFFK